MNSQQLHSSEQNEQNRADLSQADASNKLPSDVDYGDGTDIMGEPANPLHEPGRAAATNSHPHVPADSPSTGTRASIPPISDTRTPADVPSASPASTGNFPTAQMPPTLSTPANQSGASPSPTAGAASASPSPYVQTSSIPGATGKTPMDSVMQVFNKWSKKAEDMTGNVWNHLRTGPNVADTAFGRIAVGTKVMSEGGIENVYRQTFQVDPEEHLLKTYACYLSTSTGPVAGTLYISSHKLAFCSDRPLATSATHDNNTTNPPAPNATSAASKNSSSAQQQQQMCYYKVMVPISQVESVNPSENTQKKPSEKYVQVKTKDGHEFWFMGFVNYDKGVKNLQETLLSPTTSPNTNTGPNINTASDVVN